MSAAIPGPKISVVIPCYNHARYLAEAVQSVLNQSYQDLEIIIVDDGSTDNTREVIAGFGSQVRSVHQNNGGLAAARNAGILEARGEFIGLLDADDIWLPTYLATLLSVLETDRTIGAVYSGWSYVDSTNRQLSRANINVVAPEQAYEAMVFMDFLIPSAVLVRRACFEELGLFDESFRAAQGCEDWDMWLRLLGKYQMVGVAQALVHYRIHGANMSSKLEQMERAKHAVIEKHFGTDETKTALHRRAYGGLYLSSALVYYQHGEIPKGRCALERAFSTYPELTQNLDTFYQLALTQQLPSARGIFGQSDFEQCAHRVLEELDVLFDNDAPSRDLGSRRNKAYGYAQLALGLHAYESRLLAESRHYLYRALFVHPPLLFHHQVVPTLLKTYLGVTLVAYLRYLRTNVVS